MTRTEYREVFASLQEAREDAEASLEQLRHIKQQILAAEESMIRRVNAAHRRLKEFQAAHDE